MIRRIAIVVAAVSSLTLSPACGGGGGGTDAGAGGGTGGGSATGGGEGGGGGTDAGGGGCSQPCGAGTVCKDAEGICVECIDDTTCSSANPVCNLTTNVCGTGGGNLANENCSAPETITLSTLGATQTVTAALEGAMAEEGSSDCGPSDPTTAGNGDLTYMVDVAVTGGDLRLTATPTGNQDPVIIVRTDNCATGTEIACKDRGFAEDPESVVIKKATGRYFVILKTWGGVGSTTLTASLTPTPPVPVNDTCQFAQELTFTNGAATASGTTAGANNDNTATDASPSCASSARTTGIDVLYKFTIPAGGGERFAKVVVTPAQNSTLEPAVYIRAGTANCASAMETDEVACAAPAAAGTTTAVFRGAEGTEYFVWVDGFLESEGAFDISVTLTEPLTNDSCSAPAPLTFTADATTGVETATATVDLGNAVDDEQGSCSAAGKADAVYGFDLGATQYDVTLTLAPTTGGLTDTILFLRSGAACATAAELRCADREFDEAAETILVRAVSGQMFAFVEAYSAPGPVTLTLTRVPTTAIAGEVCGTAAPVTLTAGNGSVAVDTSTFFDDYDAVCGAGSTGREGVYAVTPPPDVDFDIRAEVSPLSDGGTSDAVLGVSASPCAHTQSTTIACADGYDTREITTVRNTDGGTYYVFVDSYAERNGPMNIVFSSYPVSAAPANERCITDGGLPSVAVGVPSPGTLLGAVDNWRTDGFDGGSLGHGCIGGGAVDVFYSVTPATGSSMTVTVTPTGTNATALRPGIVILDSCTPGRAVRQCSAATTAGTPVTATAPITAGSTYYIGVEGTNGTRGDFTITATTP